MRVIIAGGTGFVGRHLTDYYLTKGVSVSVISRNTAKVREHFGTDVEPLDWKALSSNGKRVIHHADLIVNLAGAGIAEQRWSNKRKKLLLDSRLLPSYQLARICATLGPDSPPLFNASAVGIYGTQVPQNEGLPPALDESTPIAVSSPLFSVQIVKRWEASLREARAAGVRVVYLRFAVVLGEAGGMLSKMIPVFKLGLGAKVGTGRQPLSWVSMQDLCRAVDFLFQYPSIIGAVNISAPNTVTQSIFAQTLAQVLHRTAFLSVPTCIIRVIFGEMGEELLLNGQHVLPSVLLANGFSFQFPSIQEALKESI